MKFTCQKVDYKHELPLAFGNYAEPRNPKVRSNTVQDRTEPCVALFQLANFAGLWMFHNIVIQNRVRRLTNLERYVTTDLIRDQMNLLPGKEGV